MFAVFSLSSAPYPKGPVQIKCKFCEKSFTGEVSLENHTLRKHPEHKKHQCTENNCEETFETKGNFKMPPG